MSAKFILFTALTICLFSCVEENKRSAGSLNSNSLGSGSITKIDSLKTPSSFNPIDTSPVNKTALKNLNWIDSLFTRYLQTTNNKLIKLALKEKLNEEWIFDQKIRTDTASYYIYQVGHNVAEEDGSDRRFLTDQWVFIDSAGRKLYEYDLANEILRK